MSKKVGYALVLIAMIVIVLILNRGTVEIELGFGSVKVLKAIAFLCFTGLGVAIGALLR